MKKIINIIGLFRTLFFSSTLILSLGQAQADYDDPGTDYTTASSGSWIEDASKEALNMVNAFVCIIKNSNGDIRPNGTWRVLIDEVACDLNSDDSVAWADVTSVSTRASNDSAQEVISYFNSADGSKYVVNTTLNESATSDYGLTMLFKWYNAYDAYGTGENLTDTGWVDDEDDNAYGFSEITLEDYNNDGTDDTVIRTAETFGDVNLGGIVVNYGGSPAGAATAFLVSAPDYSSGDGGFVTYAGALNDTEYLRQTYDSGAFGDNTCYANDNPFQTVYRYGVYDYDTGEELTISSSFGFTYETGGVSGGSGRGFLGHWGVWFDDRRDKLSSSNTSLAITNEDTEDALVINWAPGKMWQKDSSVVTLSDGEKFEVYDWSIGSRTNVTWSETNDKFLDFAGDPYKYANNTEIDVGDWFYSERFNTWVGFLGANVVDGDFEIYVEKNTNVKSHWNGTESQGIDVSVEVDFICASNCPNAKISVADYENNAFIDDEINAAYTYTLTPFNEIRTGIYPLALYKDTVDAENLVSFDPSGNWSSNTHAHIWTGNFIPEDDINDGTCGVSTDPSDEYNMYNCPNLFVWESGLREWGQGIVVTNSADRSAVTILDPIQFTYTHAAANDRNNANYATEAGAPFNYTWVETDWSDESQTTTSSTFGVDLVHGVSLNLEYEGVGQLHGFMERQTPNGWMRLMNLTDGTQITRVSDSSTYVVKALDTGYLLNTKDCSGDLSEPLAAFTTTAEVPSPTSKTKPTQIFNNAPTVTAIHVKHGEDLISPSLVQANE